MEVVGIEETFRINLAVKLTQTQRRKLPGAVRFAKSSDQELPRGLGEFSFRRKIAAKLLDLCPPQRGKVSRNFYASKRERGCAQMKARDESSNPCVSTKD